MKAVDFIVNHINEHNMTQTEAAAVAGMSRQNFWDKLNNRNPRYNTMIHILEAFGYRLHIVKKTGDELDFKESEFFESAEKENPYYDSLQAILESMGYNMLILQKEP